MPHICVSNLSIIVSDNGLSPGRRQAIIWTIAEILSTGPLGTNLSEILIKILTFLFKKMNLKVLSAKWRPFLSRPQCVNSLTPGRCDTNVKSMIFKLITQNSSLDTCCEFSLKWIPQNLTNEMSPWVPAMAWCHQAMTYISHEQIWPRFCPLV